MLNYKEQEDYRHFTTPGELHKAINTLKGIVAGITTDSKVNTDEINELINWCTLHRHLENKHPFNELLPIVDAACEDHIITDDEASDIIWLCNNFLSDADYYDLVTSSIQFLSGLVHGIMADGEITDEEIYSLKKWLDANSYLSGCYPFDEIQSLLLSILLDNVITEEERERLHAFLSNFIDLTMSYNLNEKDLLSLKDKYSLDGICAVCQNIDFNGTTFCFTGQSDKSTRNEIADIIIKTGATFRNSVSKKTDYLIVGNAGNPCWAYACYGRKIEDAVNLRKDGHKVAIINEVDFWDILEDQYAGLA